MFGYKKVWDMQIMPRVNPINLSSRTMRLAICVLLFLSMPNAIAFAHPEHTDPANQSPLLTIEISTKADLYPAKVVRIFDGDTILIEQNGIKRRIQILAANAPEFIPADKTPTPFATEARNFLSQLILDEQVFIQYDPNSQYDRFNRLAAYVYRAPDMLCINLELIRQAYAKYDVEQNTIYSEVFHHYNSRARILDRGIWNPKGSQIDWQELNPSQPTQQVVHKKAEPGVRSNQQPKKHQQPATSPSTTVYITKFGTKYHAKDCSHLSESNKATTRDEIKETHQACKSCDPDG